MGPPNVRWPVFLGAEQILLLGNPEMWGHFPKMCITLIKNMKHYGENLRKYANISRNFSFLCACGMGESQSYYIHRL